jgi:hypothetical protein
MYTHAYTYLYNNPEKKTNKYTKHTTIYGLISPIENERAEGLVSSEEGDKDQVPLEEEQGGHGEEPCEEDHHDDEESNKLLPKKRSGEEVNGSSCRVSSSLQIEKLG